MFDRTALVDVHYDADGGATGAIQVYSAPVCAACVDQHVVHVSEVVAYVPGRFADRELPVLRLLVEAVPPIDLLVVDGYVDLDPRGRAGLGRHAHDAFGVPVIGIAKSPFATATHAVEVRRGKAVKPVWVTAVGLDAGVAADVVRGMSGGSRLPDAVRSVDRLARGS